MTNCAKCDVNLSRLGRRRRPSRFYGSRFLAEPLVLSKHGKNGPQANTGPSHPRSANRKRPSISRYLHENDKCLVTCWGFFRAHRSPFTSKSWFLGISQCLLNGILTCASFAPPHYNTNITQCSTHSALLLLDRFKSFVRFYESTGNCNISVNTYSI